MLDNSVQSKSDLELINLTS